MGIEISQFRSYLATDRKGAASTQNQTLNALVFLYKLMLAIEFLDFGNSERPRKTARFLTVTFSLYFIRGERSIFNGQAHIEENQEIFVTMR
jgi:hypothetical protein